ncbi:hypothetical protein Daus18300_005460 [Diaporthe australafricana]|uniref:Ankyrin repeat protein n=1 Tax=Diaporthe australafricana TaxID=127596 RepID=A0ABR3X1N0_9PEZI
MASELLNRGANIEARRTGGVTPLHDAAASGLETMVTFLLENGADKEARTHIGQTPLLVATQEGNQGAVRALLHVGAHIEVFDSVGSNVLHTAAQRSQSEIMALLLADPMTARILNTGNRNKETPLHRATLWGSTACARMLLEHGADPDLADDLGLAPLSAALAYRNFEIAHMLVVGYKADPKHLAASGDTVMHALAFFGRAEHIHTLLSWGIDPLSRNRYRETALQNAVRHNHISFVRAFLAEVPSQDFSQKNGSDKLLAGV